jgi:hypothetical protein
MSRRARNPLDRRADKLAAEMTRREGSVYTKLTDPAPAFMVRKSEMDSVRDYLRVRANPQGLHQLRDQYGDDAVDQYVAWAENAMAKYLPQIMGSGAFPEPDVESEFTDSPTFESEDTNLFGPVSAEG